MSVIAGVFGALPPYRYSQKELTDFFVSIPDFEGYEDIVRQLHARRQSQQSPPGTAAGAVSDG